MAPTARTSSPPPSWNSPMFYPPTLSSLVNRDVPPRDPRTLPASIRFQNQPPPPFGGSKSIRYDTLEQEIEALEQLEEDHEIRNSDIKEFGYSWLIPLGRQNTHEEDDDDDLSQTSTSPRNAGQSSHSHHHHRALDQLPPPPGLDDILPPTRRPGRVGRVEDEESTGEAVVDLDAEIEDADQEDSDEEEEGEGSMSRGSEDMERSERRGSLPL
ncbi:uncharacterized protein JCM6883_002869 [Sporobolomyces salmoneus]|uniref:uncharacterized protein n=1 Tax=Sporobolomyces salmoneus TaxID=183962 RepID=UPI003179FB5B